MNKNYEVLQETILLSGIDYATITTEEYATLQETDKYRRFEGRWAKVFKYFVSGGISAVLGVLAAPITVPVGLFLYWLYRRETDICGKSGNDRYYKCYIKACDNVIKRSKKDISYIKSAKEMSDEQKNKLITRYREQIEKYEDKKSNFKQQLDK